MKKILAIDDQPDNLITIKAVIKSNLHNCEVITAQSGKEGIALAESEQPDTILLDIIMPEIDGYEVCKQLKSSEKTKHIPIVMITAIRTDSNSRIKGLNLGADAFLSKPIDPSELSAQVNVMLRIKEAEDKLRKENENLEHIILARTRELEESEKQYKSLYHFAPIPYHSLNEEGHFLDVNQAWLNLLGYKREEIIGKWYGDLLHPESVPVFSDKFPRFKKNGAVQNALFKIRHKKGNYIDIQLDGKIGCYPDGKFKQTYCVFQDITEKNKIENALKTSEERFRKAFETSPDAVNITRINDGKYISVNDGFTQIMGYSKEEVIGKSALELKIWGNIEDRQKFVNDLKTKGTVENLDAQFRTKSGEIIDGLMSAAVIDLNGVPHNINITRNVTERKKAEKAHLESERKLNTLINNLQGIAYKCKLDKNWTMEYLSAGFETITGYKSEQIINNKEIPFNNLIVYDDRERVFSEVINALKTKNTFEIKYQIKTTNGEIKHVIDRSAAIYSKENVPVALEGFIVDISSQVLAEKALIKSEEKFRFLAKNSIDCIWTMNKSLEFNFLSPALKRITGFEPKEWIGTKLKSHFTKKEYFKASTYVINAIRNNKKQSSILFETKIINKNSIEIDVEFSGNLMLDNKGNLVGLQGTIRDISNRIVSREALVESEKRFKDLSNLLPQIVYETNLNGELTFINKIGLETFGYSDNDFKSGLNILQGIAPEDKERAKNIIHNISQEKTKGNPEYLAIRKDGSTFPILIYSSIIYKKNEPIGLRGVIINITQQKEAEQALRENEQKLRLIINNSPVGVSTTDLKGRFVDVNPALCKITGYTKEEMIHKHFNEFSHPDDKAINSKKFENLVIGKIPYFKLEKRYIHKNGNIISVLIQSQLINDHQGNPLFQTAVVEDITEQKRAEQIQKVLYNISNAIVTSVDLEKLIGLIRIELGTIIDTTNFFVALYDEKTDIISLPFFADEKDNHSSIPKGKSLTKYVIETENSLLANIDLKKKLHKQGKLDYIGSLSKVWLGVPLKTEGKVTGVLAIQSYKDENAFTESDVKMLEFVSEQISISIQRKKAETDLKRALDKANESDRLKSSFLATISHELRTPLNAIIGFSEFLDKNLSSPDVEKFGQIINSSGNHLLSIVNDLFDITLIESGETKIKKENVKIKLVLQEVFSVIENYNARKDISGVDFKLIAPPEYNDLIIKTDSNKLKQILINLLKNAFKFTEKGSINYGFDVIEENNKMFLRFFVIDTGIGISKDKQELIFDIFRQAEDSNKRRFGGTGIGLSVAKRLTELLGGKIWLKSEIDKGSIFYFTIPAEKTKIKPKTIVQHDNIITNKNNLVLVAEDDDSSYVYLKTVLNKFGFESIRAINGKEAIDICTKNPEINLILMDINMPVMNGYDATKIIKAKFPQISIIAQTAYAVAGDREKVFEAGCDEYISKPIQQEVLMDKIEKIYARNNSNGFIKT